MSKIVERLRAGTEYNGHGAFGELEHEHYPASCLEVEAADYIEELEQGFLKLRQALFEYALYEFAVPAPYPENDAAFAYNGSYKLFSKIVERK